MSIQVTCRCGKLYHYKDEFAGRQTKCPACGALVQIPGGRAVASSAAPTSGAPSAAGTSAAGAASSPPAGRGRTGLFIGLGAAALVVCAGIGLLAWPLFRSAPGPKPPAAAPVQSQQQAAAPTTPSSGPQEAPPSGRPASPPPARAQAAVPTSPASGPQEAPPSGRPASPTPPARAQDVPPATKSSSNQPQNIPYPKTLDMAIDMADLTTRGHLGKLEGGELGETADVAVADGLLVTKVPVQFLKAYLSSAKAYQDAGYWGDKSKTLPASLAWLFVIYNMAEAAALGIGNSDYDKTPAMEKVNWDTKLARFHAGLVPPPAKVLSAVWLFSPGRFSPSAPLKPAYASFLQLLDRFEPGNPTTAENAFLAAEDLVWTKELGLSDGTPKTLPDARRTMQQYILETIGFKIGDVNDPDAAKRVAAIQKLEEAKALVRKAYADEAKTAGAPKAAEPEPAKAKPPDAKKQDSALGQPFVGKWGDVSIDKDRINFEFRLGGEWAATGMSSDKPRRDGGLGFVNWQGHGGGFVKWTVEGAGISFAGAVAKGTGVLLEGGKELRVSWEVENKDYRDPDRDTVFKAVLKRQSQGITSQTAKEGVSVAPSSSPGVTGAAATAAPPAEPASAYPCRVCVTEARFYQEDAAGGQTPARVSVEFQWKDGASRPPPETLTLAFRIVGAKSVTDLTPELLKSVAPMGKGFQLLSFPKEWLIEIFTRPIHNGTLVVIFPSAEKKAAPEAAAFATGKQTFLIPGAAAGHPGLTLGVALFKQDDPKLDQMQSDRYVQLSDVDCHTLELGGTGR